MKIDQSFLEAALIGYLQKRDEVSNKIAELQRQLGGGPKSAANDGRGGREMSAAARERIAAAQRKRWAAYHKSQGKKVQPAAPAKRRLSPAARKRIADATKKRWAAYRAQKAAGQKSSQEG